jgi:hemin uptake protein HemP
MQRDEDPAANTPVGRVGAGVVSLGAGQCTGVRRVPSRNLFMSDREIEIEHNGALYRLRQTAMGKLILTK